MSIVATEVSALTRPSAFRRTRFCGDWTYLQMYAGSFIGRMLIIVLLLPAFYGGGSHDGLRIPRSAIRDPPTRKTASLLFLASRVIGSGLRLLAASLAVAIVFDWPLVWVVVGTAAMAIAYTTFGGIKGDSLDRRLAKRSSLWRDQSQFWVFLFRSTPGAWSETLSTPRKMWGNFACSCGTRTRTRTRRSGC